MKDVRMNRDIKLIADKRKRNYLILEPNYHTYKWFSKKILSIKMKKTKVKMNRFVYLGYII